ncbi:MAG: cytoskeletal protein CcmA (bactofilin family) [Verrucomicrobiales bacterium]|jgi:cytoskeletal protein CcmA (bactofilin family)
MGKRTRNDWQCLLMALWLSGLGFSFGEQGDFPDDPLPDPGNLATERGALNKVLYYEITGSASGSVWGTDVYTDDSILRAAAVHSGAIGDGEIDVVRVIILPGEDSYLASTQNEVVSGSWGSWTGSYRVEAVENLEPGASSETPLPDPGNLTMERGNLNKVIYYEVTGTVSGSVWGTDVYTDDSILRAAAVHSGAIGDGETDVVRVIILPGEDSYLASTQNEVVSGNWGSWTGSYRVESVMSMNDPDVRREDEPKIIFSSGGGELVMKWFGTKDVSYVVEHSEDMGEWEALPGSQVVSDGDLSLHGLVLPQERPKAFFRIRWE